MTEAPLAVVTLVVIAVKPLGLCDPAVHPTARMGSGKARVAEEGTGQANPSKSAQLTAPTTLVVRGGKRTPPSVRRYERL